MNYRNLIETSSNLHQPSKRAADEFSEKKEVLAELVIRQLKSRKDLVNLIGNDNHDMMTDNTHNMARFMESIFIKYDNQILVETVLWVFRAYRAHGFQLTFWSAHLNTWIEEIKKEVSAESGNELLPFFFWMQVNIPVFIKLTENAFHQEE